MQETNPRELCVKSIADADLIAQLRNMEPALITSDDAVLIAIDEAADPEVEMLVLRAGDDGIADGELITQRVFLVRIDDRRTTLAMRICPPAFITALQDKMRRCHSLLTDPRGASEQPSLEDWEYEVLHDLKAGSALQGQAAVEGFRTALLAADLPYHALMRNFALHYSTREDVISQMMAGDDETAVWMLQPSIACLATAELASLDETDYRRSRLLKYLRRREDSLGQDVMATYRRYILEWPSSGLKDWVQSAIEFAEARVLQTFTRKPALIPLAMALGERASTVRHLPETA